MLTKMLSTVSSWGAMTSWVIRGVLSDLGAASLHGCLAGRLGHYWATSARSRHPGCPRLLLYLVRLIASDDRIGAEADQDVVGVFQRLSEATIPRLDAPAQVPPKKPGRPIVSQTARPRRARACQRGGRDRAQS
jgi:hypothetical protein